MGQFVASRQAVRDLLEVPYGVRSTMLGIHARDVDDNFVHPHPTAFGQLCGDVPGRLDQARPRPSLPQVSFRLGLRTKPVRKRD
ncbi:hypothetical protein ACFW9N_42625 [Streptomyces sp. NPDC059496]|uniref:hypothetical protein n=1 Tax=Streptomyces sp. NPDC059496 TaxID=3346851 RepID=UPI0036C5D9D6